MSCHVRFSSFTPLTFGGSERAPSCFILLREQRQLLEKCAATALNSKLIAGQKDFFSKMVVDAVMSLDELMSLKMIGIKKVQGGALEVGARVQHNKCDFVPPLKSLQTRILKKQINSFLFLFVFFKLFRTLS